MARPLPRVAVAALTLTALLVTLALHPFFSPAMHAASSTHAVSSAGWPTPQEETFQGCPPAGDGGDIQLNLRKNRIDSGQWQPVALTSLLALTWPKAIERVQRADWSASDAATIAQQEGRPVIAEGYLLLLRHEGVETPNCHSQGQRDYHVWLAVKPGTLADRAHSMIVELTPRVVALSPGWGSQSAILALKGKHVRISGWLMLDQEHPEQLGATRGTLWEIHPVMRIAVEQGGKWTDLASGKPVAGTQPPAVPTATTPVPALAPTNFTVSVTVSPNPMAYNTDPATVTATTRPGASCTAAVVYSTGRPPTSFHGSAQTVPASGQVSWSWQEETKGSGGTATVTCTLGSKSAQGMAQFTVA